MYVISYVCVTIKVSQISRLFSIPKKFVSQIIGATYLTKPQKNCPQTLYNVYEENP